MSQQPFLSYVSELASAGPDGAVAVFPTQRAAETFARLFADGGVRPATLPQLWRELAALPDPEELECQLWLTRQLHERLGLTRTAAFSMAKTLFSDFNDIDSALAMPDRLFNDLVNLQEIDALFAEEEAVPVVQGFVERAKVFAELYHELQAWLGDKGYPGRCIREIAQKSSGIALSGPLYVAGFQNFWKGEVEILNQLAENNEVNIVFHLIEGYDGQKDLLGIYGFVNKIKAQLSQKVKVHVLEGKAPTEVALVKVPWSLGIVDELQSQLQKPSSNTRLVLLENEQLYAAAQQQWSNLDVCFAPGTSYSKLVLGEFLTVLLEVLSRTRPAKGLWHGDVRILAQHPFLKTIDPAGCNFVINQCKKRKLLYMKPEDFSGKGLAPHVLSQAAAVPNSLKECFALLRHIVSWAEKTKSTQEAEEMALEAELLKRLVFDLSRHCEAFSEGKDFDFCLQLWRHLIGKNKLYDPDSDKTSVTHLIESQALVYDEVFVVPLTEGAVPAPANGKTFLPHAIRLAHGLPLPQEQSLWSNYHLFRLLANARKAVLYLPQATGTEPSVPSRYQHQIAFFGSTLGIELTEHAAAQQNGFSSKTTVVARLTEEDRQQIFTNALSPSRIKTFCDCPLKFWFKYVKKVKEPDKVEEEVPVHKVGSIVHEVMERLLPSKPDPATLKDEDIEALVKEQIAAHDLSEHNKVQMQNGFHLPLAVFLVRRALGSYNPGAVTSHVMEASQNAELAINGKTVQVEGIIDRVDYLANGEALVVDYKTGAANAGELKPGKELKYDTMNSLQMLVYGWLHLKNQPQPLSMQILAPASKQADVECPIKLDGIEIFHQSDLPQIEKYLAEIVGNLLYPENDTYLPTSNTQTCSNCSYSNICVR